MYHPCTTTVAIVFLSSAHDTLIEYINRADNGDNGNVSFTNYLRTAQCKIYIYIEIIILNKEDKKSVLKLPHYFYPSTYR